MDLSSSKELKEIIKRYFPILKDTAFSYGKLKRGEVTNKDILAWNADGQDLLATFPKNSIVYVIPHLNLVMSSPKKLEKCCVCGGSFNSSEFKKHQLEEHNFLSDDEDMATESPNTYFESTKGHHQQTSRSS